MNNHGTLKPLYIQIDGLNYTIYICPKNDNNVGYNSGKSWNMISNI